MARWGGRPGNLQKCGTKEGQRIRKETRRGFQKHMLRFRRVEQMQTLEDHVSLALASHALVLRYGGLDTAPVEPETLLQPRRPEDVGPDLWTTMNRVQEHLVRGVVPLNNPHLLTCFPPVQRPRSLGSESHHCFVAQSVVHLRL